MGTGTIKLKIIILGDSGTGKSSFMVRYADGIFNSNLLLTIDVDSKVQTVELGGKRVELTIWTLQKKWAERALKMTIVLYYYDTSGQERYRTITSRFYRDAHGVILVYDVSSRKSFEGVRTWINELDKYATNNNLVKMLVGNKIDQMKNSIVSRSEGLQFAESYSMPFIQASAKTGHGVQEAFEELVQKILDTPSLYATDDTGINVSSPLPKPKKKCC